MSLKKIAIFGSGAGSNAENICKYFATSTDVKVVFICSNNKNGLQTERSNKCKSSINLSMDISSSDVIEALGDVPKNMALLCHYIYTLGHLTLVHHHYLKYLLSKKIPKYLKKIFKNQLKNA